jgi:sulfur-oxidizing protein SoxY
MASRRNRLWDALGGPPAMRKSELSRRDFTIGASLGLLALLIAPHLACAGAATVEEQLRRLFGGRAMAEGRIRLRLPEVAENGLMVPMAVEVESPMKPEDHVRSVHVFADGNPSPHILTYHFTPASGRAAATCRIRLAQTQNIIAIAEMSDGALYMAKTEVMVTVGGCGD